jgi:hypothetical protein
MVNLMASSETAWQRTLVLSFLALAIFCGVLNAAAGSSSVSVTNSRAAVTPVYALMNNTTSSNSGISNITLVSASPLLTLTPAMTEALKQGPMVYAATQDYIMVIDSSTLNVISKIKPDVDKAHVTGVAVSPDGQYVYMAYSWSKFEDDYYGGHYDYYSRVMRINASTEQPIDYYEVDDIYPEHLAVSPDGRVYLGYQQAFYPENGGMKIMDFKVEKVWNLDMKYTTMMFNIEFSPDGNMVYYSGWWDAPALYELDWSVNKVRYDQLPGNGSTDYNYARSVAVCKGGGMLYAAIADRTGIFAMNTQDHGKQVIPTDYYPIALAPSPDGETLYAMGYLYDSNNKKVFLIHKYSGLKTVGPFNSDLLDYALTTKDYFYTYDSTSYITTPSGDRPSRIAITPDGRFAYISTIWGDGASNVYGDGIILYDLQYMNQVKTFDAKNSLHDVAAASSKIMFSPPPDYSWVAQFAGSSFHGTITSTLLVPTSFYPANGTFAKHYQEDWFVIDAGFSDILDNSTVNSGTFWLSEKSGANVSAKVVAASKLAILSPDSQLKPDTDYVAHLSHGIKSKDGKELYADIQWGFTTRNVTISNILPVNTLLNISLATAITPIVHLNLTVPPLLPLDNSSAANQSVQPPPEAIQNQSQGQEPQGQTGNQPQGTGGQPAVPPVPGAQKNSQQGGQGQNGTQPPANVSVQQTAQPAPNVTQPAPNATQPPANVSVPGHAAPPQQPQAPGGTGILDGIINFFKSLFGMK